MVRVTFVVSYDRPVPEVHCGDVRYALNRASTMYGYELCFIDEYGVHPRIGEYRMVEAYIDGLGFGEVLGSSRQLWRRRDEVDRRISVDCAVYEHGVFGTIFYYSELRGGFKNYGALRRYYILPRIPIIVSTVAEEKHVSGDVKKLASTYVAIPVYVDLGKILEEATSYWK